MGAGVVFTKSRRVGGDSGVQERRTGRFQRRGSGSSRCIRSTPPRGAAPGRPTLMNIEYRTGNQLDLDDMINLYVDSTLGQRRPVDQRERMAAMLANANLLITAWDAVRLVGIARSMTDWAYAT